MIRYSSIFMGQIDGFRSIWRKYFSTDHTFLIKTYFPSPPKKLYTKQMQDNFILGHVSPKKYLLGQMLGIFLVLVQYQNMANHRQLLLFISLAALFISVAPQCSITQCESCFPIESQGICENCKSGSSPNLDFTLCTQSSCIASKDTCNGCSPSLSSASSGTCVSCSVDNCILCKSDDNNICEYCQTGFKQESPGCSKCAIKNCAKCDDDITKCQECMQGYIKNSDTECAIPTCVNRQIFNGKYCSCPMMTYQFEQVTCEKCPVNCKSCDQFQCQKCNHMFYPNGNTCVACMNNCYQCTSGTTCDECNPGFIFFDGKCQPLPSKVPGTTLFHKPQTGDNQAYFCQGSCMDCSSPLVCKDCYGDYYNDDIGICKSCSSSCHQCLSTDPSACKSCEKGKFLQNFRCLPCPSDCKTCHNIQYCQVCNMGYYVKNGICTKCNVEHCISCNTAQSCSTCKLGFTPVGGNKCRECLKQCAKCEANDITKCSECFDGFYVENNSCLKCSNNCQKCTSSSVCTNCEQGYHLLNNSCVQNCEFPCLTCGENAPTSCQSCFKGYSLTNGACNEILSCSEGSTCEACPKGYVFVKNQCKKCTTTDTSCTLCLGTDLAECASCDNGFYLNTDSNSCVKCSSSCSECISGHICTKCLDGFFLGEVEEERGQCIACNPQFHCKTCNQNGQNCITCADNHFLYGRKCITNNYITFEISKVNFTIQQVTTRMNTLQGYFEDQLQILDTDITFKQVKRNEAINATLASFYLSEDTRSVKEMMELIVLLLDAEGQINFQFTYVKSFHTTNCGIANCKQCDFFPKTRICKVCVTDFKLSQDQKSCILDCGAQSAVLSPCKCSPRLVNINGFCSACNVDDCGVCESGEPNKCEICQKGFKVTAQGACQSTCENLRTCSCLPTQIQKDGKCLTCSIQDCVLCSYNDPEKCDICAESTLLSSTAKACQICQVSFCKTCKQLNTCSKCLEGYRLDRDEKCVIDIVCNSPKIFNGVECACPEQTYSSQGSCKNCPENCEFCSTSSCEICFNGYFRSSSGKCDPCLSNCDECSSSSTCNVCSEGYSFRDNECTSASEGISITSLVDLSGVEVFFACPPNCQSCSGPTTCTTCSPGYASNKGVCQLCNPICRQCSSDDKNFCIACYDGFVLDGSFCSTCPVNCNQCKNKFFCTSCLIGYYSKDGVCTQCSENCIECQSQNVCVYCAAGYTSRDGLCIPCLLGCSICTQNYQSCDKCSEGFYMKIPGQCELCPQGCKSCSLTNEVLSCQSCLPGFIKYPDNLCYQACKFPCFECEKGEPQKCTSCLAGYKFNETNNICQQDTNCNTRKDCTVCPERFSLMNDKTCQACQFQDENCLNCVNNIPAQCSGCKAGFYLQSSQDSVTCEICPSKCKLCQNPKYCSSCSPGFFVERIDNKKTGRCLQCSTKHFCQTCKDSQEQCTSCIKGYELRGQKCINKNRVKAKFVFDSNLDGLLDLLNSVIDQLSEKLKIAKESITFELIQEGSIEATLLIGAEEGADSPKVADIDTGIKQTVTSNTKQIGGVKLLQVSTEVQIGQCQVENCADCDASSATKCAKCNSNYEINGDGCIGVCQVDNCRKCQADDLFKCKDCTSQYQLTSSKSCQPLCAVEQCLQCESGDNSKCKKCEKGYVINDNDKCQLESNLGLILGLSIPLGIIAILVIILSQKKLSKSGEKQVPFESSDGIESNEI